MLVLSTLLNALNLEMMLVIDVESSCLIMLQLQNLSMNMFSFSVQVPYSSGVQLGETEHLSVSSVSTIVKALYQ